MLWRTIDRYRRPPVRPPVASGRRRVVDQADIDGAPAPVTVKLLHKSARHPFLCYPRAMTTTPIAHIPQGGMMSERHQILDSDREMFERLLQELEQPDLPALLPFDHL